MLTQQQNPQHTSDPDAVAERLRDAYPENEDVQGVLSDWSEKSETEKVAALLEAAKTIASVEGIDTSGGAAATLERVLNSDSLNRLSVPQISGNTNIAELIKAAYGADSDIVSNYDRFSDSERLAALIGATEKLAQELGIPSGEIALEEPVLVAQTEPEVVTDALTVEEIRANGTAAIEAAREKFIERALEEYPAGAENYPGSAITEDLQRVHNERVVELAANAFRNKPEVRALQRLVSEADPNIDQAEALTRSVTEIGENSSATLNVTDIRNRVLANPEVASSEYTAIRTGPYQDKLNEMLAGTEDFSSRMLEPLLEGIDDVVLRGRIIQAGRAAHERLVESNDIELSDYMVKPDFDQLMSEAMEEAGLTPDSPQDARNEVAREVRDSFIRFQQIQASVSAFEREGHQPNAHTLDSFERDISSLVVTDAMKNRASAAFEAALLADPELQTVVQEQKQIIADREAAEAARIAEREAAKQRRAEYLAMIEEARQGAAERQRQSARRAELEAEVGAEAVELTEDSVFAERFPGLDEQQRLQLAAAIKGSDTELDFASGAATLEKEFARFALEKYSGRELSFSDTYSLGAAVRNFRQEQGLPMGDPMRLYSDEMSALYDYVNSQDFTNTDGALDFSFSPGVYTGEVTAEMQAEIDSERFQAIYSGFSEREQVDIAALKAGLISFNASEIRDMGILGEVVEAGLTELNEGYANLLSSSVNDQTYKNDVWSMFRSSQDLDYSAVVDAESFNVLEKALQDQIEHSEENFGLNAETILDQRMSRTDITPFSGPLVSETVQNHPDYERLNSFFGDNYPAAEKAAIIAHALGEGVRNVGEASFSDSPEHKAISRFYVQGFQEIQRHSSNALFSDLDLNPGWWRSSVSVGSVDFTSSITNAVRVFQGNKELEVTGMASPETTLALIEMLSERRYQGGDTFGPEVRTWLDDKLNAAGPSRE